MRAPLAQFHLAQVNVMRMRAPLDDATMADFVALLAPVNALAERSPGFVWRLKTDEGDATAIRVVDDDRILVNFSVWESQLQLWNFAYASRHLDVMRRRREWAERLPTRTHVIWWVPAGSLPTLDDALAKLERLRAFGPTPEAFTFRDSFPHPVALHVESNGHSPARYRDGEARREPAAGLGSVPSLPTRPIAR